MPNKVEPPAGPATPAMLAKVSLFAPLSPDQLDGLVACLKSRRYRKGQTIFLQGDPGQGLYLIAAGRVKIIVTSAEGKGIVVNRLGPDDFFGELALLDGDPRSADAIAEEPCHLWLLPREEFLRFLESRPQVAIGLLAAVSRRLRRTTRLVQDVAFLDVPTRLARVLLDLAAIHGQPDGAGLTIARRLTQAELAEMAGATRESVNKWIKFYERLGLLRRERGTITLLRPDELRQRTA